MSPTTGRLTVEEYLARERVSMHRSEMADGQTRLMPRNSRAHNLIVGNLLRGIQRSNGESAREVFAMSMRVGGVRPRFYAYPDLVVACESPLFEDEHEDTLLNPSILIEVTADATEVVDRRKLGLYGRLPSVREFILVSQEKASAEQYERDGEGWMVRFVEGPDAALHLGALGCTVSLGMVYSGVEFPPRCLLDPVTLRL